MGVPGASARLPGHAGTACAPAPKYRRTDRRRPDAPLHRQPPSGRSPVPAQSHHGEKFTTVFDWPMLVKPEPFTLAVLFWFEAPEPVATCWVVVEFP